MTDDGTCLPAASLLLDEQLCFTVYAAQRAATAAADGGRGSGRAGWRGRGRSCTPSPRASAHRRTAPADPTPADLATRW
ncbi:hypothetical protein ACFYWN_20710 [Streptomyces sp. NPDC002917]|uniref:hypothetical protein n=1 Tax=unclassified Streptomyces TaxID=2593676 RepID=UPI002E7FDA94|nr:hypothetical protein [Streptomyces sp. NBC_00562]WTC81418.1 hypothetical protein OH719_28395 [Streptomyces sp. NBC_01653]WTD33975.1 hypothetical protein OHB03_18030 [Streptomyces sp. NBC_01643]WTD89447.1 hypothetical protein OG891_18475 [Streptomyces sp. NBC_01637]WUC20432.1 hypothetical protein OHA33_17010 [Streptomyces sp. NBC_00562]